MANGLSFCVYGTSTARVLSIQRAFLKVRNKGYNANILDSDIESRTKEGVLLLNTALTIPVLESKKHGIINGDNIGCHLQNYFLIF